MKYKALLFGSIGTLIESSNIQRNSFNEAFKEAGLEWYWDDNERVYTPLLVAMERANVAGQGSAPNYVLRALLRGGATLDMTLIERYGYAVPTHPDYPYVARVHAAGGWKRYEQAHIARLAPIFAKIFPRPRLPQELVAQVLRFCFHTGFY